MSKINCPIYSVRSIADVVLSSNIKRWRKWALRKLMPAELWELPPQKLAKLQKGAIIANVTITTASAS